MNIRFQFFKYKLLSLVMIQKCLLSFFLLLFLSSCTTPKTETYSPLNLPLEYSSDGIFNYSEGIPIVDSVAYAKLIGDKAIEQMKRYMSTAPLNTFNMDSFIDAYYHRAAIIGELPSRENSKRKLVYALELENEKGETSTCIVCCIYVNDQLVDTKIVAANICTQESCTKTLRLDGRLYENNGVLKLAQKIAFYSSGIRTEDTLNVEFK